MLNQTSKNLKTLFLLQFTKELIENTETYRKLKIREEIRGVIKEEEGDKKKEDLEPKRREIREIVREKIKRDIKIVNQLEKEGIPMEIVTLSKPFFTRGIGERPRSGVPRILRIPEPRLPPTVQHIKPIPTRREIDLGKLNPLIKDPLVKIMECSGPNKKIVVSGAMERKNTSITLNKREIDEIINKFSEEAKIPAQEGIFKAAVGRLILSAVISETVGSKFVIRKMGYSEF